MKKLLICFGANNKLGYFGGHFYTFRAFFKIKVQNGNVFGGSQNFKCVFYLGWGVGVCLIFTFFFLEGGGG